MQLTNNTLHYAIHEIELSHIVWAYIDRWLYDIQDINKTRMLEGQYLRRSVLTQDSRPWRILLKHSQDQSNWRKRKYYTQHMVALVVNRAEPGLSKY